ncbi:MAG TPA: four helix bundle protein [Bacteroidia bacterium]|nr:four helix bundle protein [Bacteroidia bacterium]
METEKKKYDLEDRTLAFSKSIRDFIKTCPKSVTNTVYMRQLARSSSSVGANYIEANDSIGAKDKLMRIRICRKEAKESVYWLKLIDTNNDNDVNRSELIKEANELMLILGAILKKLSNTN